MRARMKNPAMVLPGAMESIQGLFKATSRGGVPQETLDLMHLRVSQINGCSACVDSGVKSGGGSMGLGVTRQHHYVVDPADTGEFIRRRAAVIDAIRAAHPGLVETRLIRLSDGSYLDTWRWATMAQMGAAAADLGSFPQAVAAMSLTTERSAVDGEIIDER